MLQKISVIYMTWSQNKVTRVKIKKEYMVLCWHMLVKSMCISLEYRRAFLELVSQLQCKTSHSLDGNRIQPVLPCSHRDNGTVLFWNDPNVHKWIVHSQMSHLGHKNNLAHDFLPLNRRNETRNHLVVCFQTFEGIKPLVCIVACL